MQTKSEVLLNPELRIVKPLGFIQRTAQANAHWAHLQAPTHRLILQLVKEPNFFQRLTQNRNQKVWRQEKVELNILTSILKL